MALTSHKRGNALSGALFFLALLVLPVTGAWWPGLMLTIGFPLALRQYLSGRPYDALLSLLLFVGTFVTVQYDLPWQLLLPILFSLGALSILCRECFLPDPMSERDKEEDLQHEIEEDEQP